MGFELVGVKLENGPPQNFAALEALLARHTVSRHGNRYSLKFPEETALEFSADELTDSSEIVTQEFRLGGLGEQQLSFVYEFAVAADLVFVNGTEDNALILVRHDQSARVPEEMRSAFDNVAVCESGNQLLAIIENGYDSFLELRDRVLNDRNKSDQQN